MTSTFANPLENKIINFKTIFKNAKNKGNKKSVAKII